MNNKATRIRIWTLIRELRVFTNQEIRNRSGASYKVVQQYVFKLQQLDFLEVVEKHSGWHGYSTYRLVKDPGPNPPDVRRRNIDGKIVELKIPDSRLRIWRVLDVFAQEFTSKLIAEHADVPEPTVKEYLLCLRKCGYISLIRPPSPGVKAAYKREIYNGPIPPFPEVGGVFDHNLNSFIPHREEDFRKRTVFTKASCIEEAFINSPAESTNTTEEILSLIPHKSESISYHKQYSTNSLDEILESDEATSRYQQIQYAGVDNYALLLNIFRNELNRIYHFGLSEEHIDINLEVEENYDYTSTKSHIEDDPNFTMINTYATSVVSPFLSLLVFNLNVQLNSISNIARHLKVLYRSISFVEESKICQHSGLNSCLLDEDVDNHQNFKVLNKPPAAKTSNRLGEKFLGGDDVLVEHLIDLTNNVYQEILLLKLELEEIVNNQKYDEKE